MPLMLENTIEARFKNHTFL